MQLREAQMEENDSFRLVTREQAGIAIAAGVALWIIFWPYLIGPRSFEPEITAQHVKEATERKEMRPCDFALIQYGPEAERRNPECVKVSAGPLPNHVLTLPVTERRK
jgi:hypothetical protein